MRAAVFYGREDLRIEDVPKPDPAPGEVLVEVHASGICGTDAAEFRHGPNWYRVSAAGHIPGHEFAGRVVAVGAGADWGLLDQPVACGAVVPCGHCRPCTLGRPGACTQLTVVGAQRAGGLAEYCAVPAATCRRLTAHGVSTDVAALAQPLAVAVHVWGRSGARRGERVLVVGAGAIGQLVGLASAGSGVELTVCDVDAAALARATELCGARALPAGAPDAGPEDRSYDLVLECSGTPAGMRTAARAVRPAGRVVIVGHQPRPVEIDLRELTRLEVDLVGTNALDPDTDIDAALRVLATLEFSVWRALAPRLIPLERVVADGFAALGARGAGTSKVLVDPRATRERPLACAPGL